MKKGLGTEAPAASRLSTATRAAEPTSAGGEPLPRAEPEDVGMSSERLARIGTALKEDIERGLMPGAVIAIARRGKLVALDAYGWRNKASGVPMTTDSIFPVASMLKPVVSFASLMLYEQGRLLMDDPLSKYFPQFANMRVAARDSLGRPTTDTVPAVRQITIQDLSRHTSGTVYGSFGTTVIHKMYPSGSFAITDMSPEQCVDMFAALPLLHQPGEVWDYGFGQDLLGLVIEKISGQRLGEFLQANLFGPLGMTDTTFCIPPEKVARIVHPFAVDPISGQPQVSRAFTTRLCIECGGGCASSTATDYLRFALMLLNKGQSGNTRILGRKTVEYMLSDHLGSKIANFIANADPTRANFTFGLGLAIKSTTGIAPMMGSPGMFTWPGTTGTDWWADPQEDLAVVYLGATPGPMRWYYRQKINALVYQAIDD